MRDAVRDEWLSAQGVRVLRYPAIDVMANMDDVVRQIVVIALERRGGFEG